MRNNAADLMRMTLLYIAHLWTILQFEWVRFTQQKPRGEIEQPRENSRLVD